MALTRITLVAVLLAACASRPARAPEPRALHPLGDETFAELVAAFDQAADRPRIVAAFSPT